MEQQILGTISKCSKHMKVVVKSQHGFLKRSCLTNVIAFYGETTGLVHERRAVDVVYHDFGRTFNLVSNNIPINKLIKNSRDK